MKSLPALSLGPGLEGREQLEQVAEVPESCCSVVSDSL